PMRPESSSARMSRSESRVTYPMVVVPPPARSNPYRRSAAEPAEAGRWTLECTTGGHSAAHREVEWVLEMAGAHAVEDAVRQRSRKRPRTRAGKRHAQTMSQTDNDSGNLCWFFPVCLPTATDECFRVMSCTDPRTMVPSPS